MPVVSKKFQIDSRAFGEVLDITDSCNQKLAESGLKNGIATVFTKHTTAAITIIELEKGMIQDLKDHWAKLLPANATYQHNVLNNDTNGHSHVSASIIGPSLVVPFESGKLMLGQWQKIVMIDFDSKARTRDLVLQIIGE